MPALFEHEVLLVTGKGGVGKSTVASVLARAAARRGKRVLLVEFESVSRAAPLFGAQDAGTEPQKVADNLWLRGFDTMDSLQFFAVQQVKIERVAQLVLRNETVRGFFMAMPAIKSVTFLYHLWRLVEDHGPRGDRTWDLVVCDLPTTGFILGLYGVPTMVQQIFHVGPLARITQGMGDFLYDTERVGLVMVTLPEEMPVVETIEFVQTLRDKHGVAATATVVNGVVAALLDGDELAQARRAATAGGHQGGGSLGAMLASANMLLGRSERAARLKPMLAESTRAPVLELPHLFKRKLPLVDVDRLATVLLQRLDGLAGVASPHGAS